jgi:hypothetical protein
MNVIQFLERWPAKEGRRFFFAGGKPHDRLAVFYAVCDHWRGRVDKVDFDRLHNPTIPQISEACRQDPLASKFRVVAATEMDWQDPDEITDKDAKRTATRHFHALGRLVETLPSDTVLIMSTPVDSPLTKNNTAQAIIRKGYWVVLTQTDVETAIRLTHHLTGWTDEEMVREVVEAVGTSPAAIISFLKVLRLATTDPTPKDVRRFLSVHVTGGVFELVDAVVMKDAPRALRLADSVPSGQFIGALDRKLTSLLQFSAELKRGRTPKEAAMMLRLPGFIVHGLYEASKRWTGAEIISVYPTLAEHSISGDKPGANDVLVRKLCGVG